MPTNDIGSRIAQRRKELNMTQGELAEKCGYSSYTTIAKIEAGANNLRQTKIAQIAKALDCSPVWLIGLTDGIVPRTDYIVSYPDETEAFVEIKNPLDESYYVKVKDILNDASKRKLLMGIIDTLSDN